MAHIVDRQTVYQGWATVHRLEIEEDGRRYKREVIDQGNAVAVLPYDPVRRCACMVRQLRGPVLYVAGGDGMLLEPPAGRIDPGETAEDAARREVMEETGYRIAALEPLGSVWTSPGITAERTTLFLAAVTQQARIAPGGGIAGEHENITVVELPLADLAAMADQGGVNDMCALLLVLALRQRHPELFAEKAASGETGAALRPK